MAGKRISALTEQTGLSSGDFFGVDNAGQTASKKLNSEYFTKRFANVQNDTAFPTGDAYSSSSSYKVGDYVTHNDVLYRCKTACSAASWTVNATNFKEASLTKAVTDLNSSLTSTKIHDDGNVVVYRAGNVCVAEFVGAAYNYTFNVGDANKPKTTSYAPCRLKNPSNQYFNALAIVDASGTFYFVNWDGATLPNGSMLGSITWIC